MEDPDGTVSSVAQCIEQLRRSSTTAQEKENSLKQLLDLIETRDNSFGAVGSHSQAVPALVALLRSGSLGVKMLAASVLGSLCKEEELRIKVLLGGCIPPLLALLKSSSVEGRTEYGPLRQSPWGSAPSCVRQWRSRLVAPPGQRPGLLPVRSGPPGQHFSVVPGPGGISRRWRHARHLRWSQRTSR